jgi:GAF domain-containing protein
MEDLKLKQLSELFEDTDNFIANASNLASFIYNELQEISWSGFYFLTGEELLLGPFCGKPACVKIPLGKGVCGTSAIKKTTLIVPDTHKFEGHIACDAGSNSEIVVPLIHKGDLIGVLDLDSYSFNRFKENDEQFLKGALELLLEKSFVGALKLYYNSDPTKIKTSLKTK